MASDSKLPPTGRFQRLRKLAGLSAQLGADVVARGVKRLAGADPEALSLGTAEKLVATLGDLKGAAMKFGQMVSMEPDLFSPEVRAVLARLQNEAPPMPYETVAEVVERELGRPPDAVFARFDREPMAAASLGQVHRAALRGGHEVVVKVQYPGIGEAMASDLDNLGTMVKAVSVAIKGGETYYAELRKEFLAELDYHREAELCRRFAKSAAPLPDIKVPKVYEKQSAERVLTLEYLPGPTLKERIGRRDLPNAERYRISRLLLRAVYGVFLVSGDIHADPHPGNYLILEDGRIGVCDFGAVKQLSPGFVDICRHVLKGGVALEELDYLALAREMGFTFGDLPEAEAKSLVGEMMHIAGRPIRAAEYDFGACRIPPDLRMLAAKNATKVMKIRPPVEAILFFRVIAGCAQNLRTIGSKGDFQAIYRELSELA